MARNNDDLPFVELGNVLRRIRTTHKETIGDVSGAVEIDAITLRDIEHGKARPSEDILLLLISHFALKEDEASRLWNLAGYQDGDAPFTTFPEAETTAEKLVMAMPSDVRIVYTDTVHVVVNNFGVVMNFMQTAGPGGQPLMVSRVGMSREHAQSVLEVLQKTLAASTQPRTPRQLPHKTTDNQQSSV
jgi:transcriptional regulator with XRE-family HTH domain